MTVLEAIAARDGSVYVAGLTHPTRADRNLYAARVDPASGDLVWELELGGPDWDEAWDLAATADALYVAGYETPAGQATTQAAIWVVDPATGAVLRERAWGEAAANDEARALALDGDTIFVTGGVQNGRSTDIFVAALEPDTLATRWTSTTGGTVVGGGGYGIAVGERGIYVAAGNYDFPAGGDAAILRFSHDGALEWSQIMGYPGFWDWGFDVDARDGRFYVAGVLWRPGAEWYQILTVAYDENFRMASLESVAAETASGDIAGAREAMTHFWLGDFLRWAKAGGAQTFRPEPVAPTGPPGSVAPGEIGPAPSTPPLPDPSGIGSPDPSGPTSTGRAPRASGGTTASSGSTAIATRRWGTTARPRPSPDSATTSRPETTLWSGTTPACA